MLKLTSQFYFPAARDDNQALDNREWKTSFVSAENVKLSLSATIAKCLYHFQKFHGLFLKSREKHRTKLSKK